MEVTQPKGWVALIAAWVVVLVALLWSIFGSIPTSVIGSGIIMSSAGIREVEVLGSGVVDSLAVEEGDLIEVGDLIARVGQPLIRQRIAQAREQLRLLESERRTRESFTSRNTELESETIDREETDLQRRMLVARERISWLEGRLQAETEALALGLITDEALQNTVQQLEGARAELNGLDLAVQNTGLKRLLLDNRAFETIEAINDRIREADANLESLILELEQSSTVVSPYRGLVREIRTDVGQLAVAGQAIVSIEMIGAPLHAVVFVPSEGKQIQVGMNVQVSPVTARREEFGFLVGSVSSVSTQPATPQGMRRTLNNDILVEQLSRSGAPFVVEVQLEPGDTFSGFRWSSQDGPPLTIESGTSVEVRVVVESHAPITLVLPIFRSVLGLAA